jgi:hypothetical protein
VRLRFRVPNTNQNCDAWEPVGTIFSFANERKRLTLVPIVEKLKKSFEASKESYVNWIVLGICIAVAAICALVGIMIWVADYIGAVPSCFLFSGLFILAAGIVKFVIDAKAKEATRKLNSAKQEIRDDVAAITKPVKFAREVVPRHPFPVASVALLAILSLLAYYLKGEEAPRA